MRGLIHFIVQSFFFLTLVYCLLYSTGMRADDLMNLVQGNLSALHTGGETGSIQDSPEPDRTGTVDSTQMESPETEEPPILHEESQESTEPTSVTTP